MSVTSAGISNVAKKKKPDTNSPTSAGFNNLTRRADEEAARMNNPTAPTLANEAKLKETQAPPSIGDALRGLEDEARQAVDPRAQTAMKPFEVAEAGGELLSLAVPGPAGKAKVASNVKLAGERVKDATALAALFGNKAARLKVDVQTKIDNSLNTLKPVVGRIDNKVPTPGNVVANSRNAGLIAQAANAVWGDRSNRFKQILTAAAMSAAGSASLSAWWNYETAQGFGFISGEYYRNARFAESPEERQVLIDAADELAQDNIDALERTPIEWVLSFVPGASQIQDTLNSIDRVRRQVEVRKEVMRDVDAVVNDLSGGGDASGLDDNAVWAEIHTRNQERELSQATRLSEIRVWTEGQVQELRDRSRALGNAEEVRKAEQLAKVWAKAHEDKLEREREYWTWYYEYQTEMRNSNARSQLGFGLL